MRPPSAHPAARRRWRTTLGGRCSTLAWNLHQRYPQLRVTGTELVLALGHPSRCYLCGCGLRLHEAEADHAFPLVRRGPVVLDNLRWAHKACNRLKATLTVFELYDLARKIARHLGRTRGCYK